MKKAKKILFLILLFVGVFFIPSNVRAENILQEIITRTDEAYNKVFEDFKNEAEKSLYGAVICHIHLEYKMFGMTESTEDLYWLVQSNGEGNATIETNHKLSFLTVQKNDFKHKPELFYDDKNNVGKCPDTVYFTINKDLVSNSDAYITADNYYGDLIVTKGFIGKVEGVVRGGIDYFQESMVEEYNNQKPWVADGVIISSDDFSECESLLGDPEDSDSLAWLINQFLLYFKIIAPIMVLILSVVDFSKAIVINDEETMKKSQKKLIARIILAISLFLVPNIIELLFDVFGFTSNGCLK